MTWEVTGKVKIKQALFLFLPRKVVLSERLMPREGSGRRKARRGWVCGWKSSSSPSWGLSTPCPAQLLLRWKCSCTVSCSRSLLSSKSIHKRGSLIKGANRAFGFRREKRREIKERWQRREGKDLRNAFITLTPIQNGLKYRTPSDSKH